MKWLYRILAIANIANGLWMLAAPAGWFADLPAAVPDTGPFNAHFVRDLGVVFIGVRRRLCLVRGESRRGSSGPPRHHRVLCGTRGDTRGRHPERPAAGESLVDRHARGVCPYGLARSHGARPPSQAPAGGIALVAGEFRIDLVEGGTMTRLNSTRAGSSHHSLRAHRLRGAWIRHGGTVHSRTAALRIRVAGRARRLGIPTAIDRRKSTPGS